MSRQPSRKRTLGSILSARLAGPGGYYNVGNALALATGLGVQIAIAAGSGPDEPNTVLEAVRAYFVGSPGATALTLAILIFLASGEMYHRAWSEGFPPSRRWNRWGDLLSGIGAVALTAALAAFGDILLAIVSGLLLAAGKFGSALVPEDYEAPEASRWPRRFRVAVLASRIPALAALAFELVGILASETAAPTGSLILTPVMLICYLLWARADLLLMRPAAPGHGPNLPGDSAVPKNPTRGEGDRHVSGFGARLFALRTHDLANCSRDNAVHVMPVPGALSARF